VLKSENGVSALLVAAALMMFMGFAAVTIDIAGIQFNERRLDQNGADIAALAGAIELTRGHDPQAAVDAALASVDANVRAVAAADWAGSCSDLGALALTASSLGLSPATECLSFSSDFREFRVRLPEQQQSTTFGQALGARSVSSRAAATASARQFAAGLPRPFAVLDGFEAGDEACLRTSSSLSDAPPRMVGNGPGNPASLSINPTADADPCDDDVMDADSEFMGTLDPKVWFDATGTPQCSSNELAYMIAAGLDHPISRFIDYPVYGASPRYGTGGYPTPDPREIGEACGTATSPWPNTFELDTGTDAAALRCGLLTTKGGGCDSDVPGPHGLRSPALLHQGDHVEGWKFVGEVMDNAPLWQFLDLEPSGSYPAVCKTLAANSNNASWDYFDKKEAMLDCLARWKDNNYDVLFSPDLATSARFAFVPLLAESNMNVGSPDGPTACSVGNKCVHVDDFVPVFLQTLYTRGNGLSSDCDPAGVKIGRHEAGQQFDCGSSNDNLEGVSSIVLGCSMLPSTLCDGRAGNPHDPGGNPTPLILLTD
jgi:hypothetical protein